MVATRELPLMVSFLQLPQRPGLSPGSSSFLNDISTVISQSKVKLFADDATIYKEISSPDDRC